MNPKILPDSIYQSREVVILNSALNIDSLHEICIERLLSDGRGMGRIDGLVCFVSDAVPGDTLLVKITAVKSGYAEAEIAEIHEASEYRVEPFCRHFGECGGCRLQHIDPGMQFRLKCDSFLDSMKRIGKIPLDRLPELQRIKGRDKGYRNRMRFAALPDAEWGLRKRSSVDVFPVWECPVAHPGIQHALQTSACPQHIRSGNDFSVFADDNAVFFSGELAHTGLLGHSFSFMADDFFQSNTGVFEKSIDPICSGIQEGLVADLYGGIGVLAYFAAEQNRAVSSLSVDSSDSVRTSDARITFRKMSVEKWVSSPESGTFFSCIILDPPRPGLSKKVLSYLTDQARSSEVRYMSCNPDTFARDAGDLLRKGMQLKSLYAMDFYPHTAHLEVLGVFTYA